MRLPGVWGCGFWAPTLFGGEAVESVSGEAIGRFMVWKGEGTPRTTMHA